MSAGQNTQQSVFSVCFAHQAMLKSIAVNVRKIMRKKFRSHSFVKLRWLYNFS